jgi:hypothetical protein
VELMEMEIEMERKEQKGGSRENYVVLKKRVVEVGLASGYSGRI